MDADQVGNLKRIFLLASVLTGVSSTAFGYLKCDEAQKTCITEHKDLTIGDRIGFFTAEDKIVAVGVVDDMEGERRKISVTRRFAGIRKSNTVALLHNKAYDERNLEVYKVYRDPSEKSFGGAAGIASMSVGEPKSSYELTGHYQWRTWKNFRFLGRGFYLLGNSEVSRASDELGIETKPFALQAVGLLPSAAFVAFHNSPVSFRAEAGLGPVFLDGKVGGRASEVSGAEFETKVENGLWIAGRGSAGVVYNKDVWHGDLSVAYTAYRAAAHTALSFGLGYDLRPE